MKLFQLYAAFLSAVILVGPACGQGKKGNPPPKKDPPPAQKVVQPQPQPQPPPQPQPQPKNVQPAPQPVVQPKPPVNPPPVVQQPKVQTPPPVVQQPKVVDPPKVVAPVVQQPKVVDPPKVVAPPVQPKTPPPVIGQPKVVDPPKVVPPKTPPVIAQPKVVDPPKVVPPVVPPKTPVPPVVVQPKTPVVPNTAKVAPIKVAPKVDPVRNPVTKIDPAKVDPANVKKVNQEVANVFKQGESNLISKKKIDNQEFNTAGKKARDDFQKTLTPEQLKKANAYEQSRIAFQDKQRQTLKVNPPPPISKDASKLVANAPTKATKDSAKFLALNSSDNAKLIAIKNNSNDPFAKKSIDSVLSGKQVSASEFTYLQAQLNNPTLNTGQKAAIAGALQNQADIRRQNSFVNSLNQLNGNFANNKFPGKKFPGPGPFPPPPPNNNNFGGAFAGGFVGGFLGSMVGNLVYPGSGYIVPGGYGPGYIADPYYGYYGPGLIPATVLFNPVVYVGYVPIAPAVYYPATPGLDLSGTVLVQTLPCGCTTAFSSPVDVTPEPGVIVQPPQPVDDPGNPAIVIDPTSQEAKLTTRYLRVINSSDEKATVSIVLRTPADDGSFVWLPDEPGKGDGAFTVELLPGEERDVFSGDTQLHGSRARIWATGDSGRTWRQFENVDFWLVPETEEDGTHAYSAPGMETTVYNLK